MDFKFEARPDVIWGETARLGYAASCLRSKNQGSRFLLQSCLRLHFDFDVSNYVTFNNHPRTYAPWPVCWLLSVTVPACKTRTFQASYFVRSGGTTYATKLSLVVLPLLAVYNYF